MRSEISVPKGSRWSFVRRAPSRGNHGRWICRCSCGSVKDVDASSVRRGVSKSCGCLALEARSTHGMSNTREYKTWEGMVQRCENPRTPGFYKYGGRGIKVCSRWRRFENFFEDMGTRPENTSLDRIDNNNGYFKENCRWATPVEQSRNTRRTTVITYLGESGSIYYWADKKNLSPAAIRGRLNRGWSVSRTLTTELRIYKPRNHRSV